MRSVPRRVRVPGASPVTAAFWTSRVCAPWRRCIFQTKALSGDKRAIWGISHRRDSVVPLAVEFGAFDVDCGHLGVRDDNAAGVLASIEFAAHGEAGFGGAGRDQFDDDLVADERLGAPVLADEGEEPVFDFVPLAGAGRQSLPRRRPGWLTTMSKPSSLASFCNSRFHSRTREPLLPPPSAVISNRVAS